MAAKEEFEYGRFIIDAEDENGSKAIFMVRGTDVKEVARMLPGGYTARDF